MRRLKIDDALNDIPGASGSKIFEFDAEKKEAFLADLKKREDQLEGLLLWCSIIILVSYLAVMITIVKYYISFGAGDILYIISTLLFALLLFGSFVWLQFKVNTYRPAGSNIPLKELLNFKTHVARRQIGLLKTCIIAYTVITGGLCILCSYHTGDAKTVLLATLPLSIMVYGAGLFLLFKLAYKRKTYLNYVKKIDGILLKEFGRQ